MSKRLPKNTTSHPFRCAKCGAEWGVRRGGHKTKIGDECQSLLTEGKWTILCSGKLELI